MKSSSINFAPHSLLWTILQTRPLTWIFAGIFLVLCVSVGSAIFRVNKMRGEVEADVQKIHRQLAEKAAHQPVPKKNLTTEAQAASINTAVAQLNLPWRDVFDAVEAATPPSIALLTLEPDTKMHLFKGTAEAKNSDAMIAYIEQLKKQVFFIDVVLIKHDIMEQDVNKPIRFQFDVQWMEAM